MAANYWASTQRRHWLFTREKLAEIREIFRESDKVAHSQFPLPDQRLLNIYFSQQLIKLGKRMSTRQQALATAQVYIKRFYTKNEIRHTNPYLVLTTAFYLSCKMEECPQHIRFVVGEARSLWPEFITPDVSKLGECEFSLISEMNSQLIVHHPYRTLSELQPELSLTSDEVALAWSVINDHYLTDLPLLYAPHVIAVMAIIVAVVFKPSSGNFHGSAAPVLAGAMRDGGMNVLAALGDRTGSGPPPKIQKLISWLAESEVDIKGVIECTQELVSLYEVWEQYSEKTCKELLGRMVKTKNLDK
ncbi:cyclin-dependent protein serine/threonine kinase regulator SSN8 [Aspergillus novofumigatus IBT 16806]|uniref:RNA polymerase II holoenzyme cyclin-like subunit n=1 Tax=Aspergillus novofumigatus (strain IBT 16806) TaxID=1392255 RepID=A0A2I1CP62_ASPN1|nr:putative RNA polymerase II holoenzyme cyclin-like subunit [Aspergillus novofumigatus IBT 16806]PKX99406.1 putative RNA polymerase II holoenzyme cyclin-like subunit [Aspergillus novofumigatus IBT 16806]